MHTKDFLPSGDHAGAELGRGMIDYQPILDAARHAGLKHCFVEQEGPYKRMGQLDAACVDYDYLRRLY